MSAPEAVPVFGDLRGKVIVVTGGCGQLGRVFCRGLVAAGATVYALDLATEPSSAEGESWARLRANVMDRGELEAALGRITDEVGPPHGLVNAAALDSPPGSDAALNGPFEGFPGELWDKIIGVNLKGIFLACQVFGGAMAAAGRGSVVMISSIYGTVSPDQRCYRYRVEDGGAPFFKPAAYSASKSALAGLTRYLSTYWAGSGVRVNNLIFGGVWNGQDPRFVREYESRTPLGRMARAEEYIGPLGFLLSDASGYMTGADLVVDGGFTAW